MFVDSTIIILNQNDRGNQLFSYSLKTGIGSYINIGEGPENATGLIGLGVIGNFLWTYDFVSSEILTMNIKNVLNNDSVINIREFPIKGNYYDISLIDKAHYCANGESNSLYKVQIADLESDKIVSEIGKCGTISNLADARLYKDIYQSFIFTNPSNNKILTACRFTDVIEIFDIKQKTSFAVQGPECFDVEYTTTAGVMMRNDKTRFAFIGGSVTDKFIYLAYSGKLNNKEAYTAKYVYVYNWYGVPVKKYILDKSISCLVVSNDDKTMYAYNRDTGYLIYAEL